MTDNEIIKAYELCHSDALCDETNCPFFAKCKTEDLSRYILDLINRQNEIIDRQKDQIELLEIEKQALRGAANSYKAELEEKTRRLKGILPIVAQLKTEAVNEFAEEIISDLTLLAKHEDKFRQSVILGVVHTIEAKKRNGG